MANNPALSITVDSAGVVSMLTAASEKTALRIGQLVEGAAIAVQREMRLVAPVGVTGQLRNSIRYVYTPALLSAEVGPQADYAAAVETGSKPHWPPYGDGSSIADWANLKGIPAFLVARSIARKGTKAHPFVKPTYDKMKPVVEEQISVGIRALVEEVNSGSL